MDDPGPTHDPARDDPRVPVILDIVAREASVERSRLQLDAGTEDLGITSLDLTLVVFEIEKHFSVEIVEMPEPPATEPMTVGLLVRHMLRLIDQAARTAPAAAVTSASAANAAST
jgi:Phosphopantetheine attachment site